MEPTRKNKCSANALLHILNREHPHLNIWKVQWEKGNPENGFIECGGPIKIIRRNLEPTDGMLHKGNFSG
jgi:hypothetical protein